MTTDLTDRERATLKFIVDYRSRNLGMSPSTREVFDHLQETLPKRKRGKAILPPLVSLVQVTRIIAALRQKGMLADPEIHAALFAKARNLIPTREGEKAARAE